MLVCYRGAGSSVNIVDLKSSYNICDFGRFENANAIIVNFSEELFFINKRAIIIEIVILLRNIFVTKNKGGQMIFLHVVTVNTFCHPEWSRRNPLSLLLLENCLSPSWHSPPSTFGRELPCTTQFAEESKVFKAKSHLLQCYPIVITSDWGLTACHDLQAHFFARWAEYYNSFCLIILDENIPSSSGRYINSVKKKKMTSFSRISNDPFQDIRDWMYLFSITFPLIVKPKY